MLKEEKSTPRLRIISTNRETTIHPGICNHRKTGNKNVDDTQNLYNLFTSLQESSLQYTII